MERDLPHSEDPPQEEGGLESETVATIVPKWSEKGLLRAFVSLRQRNFRLFWFGQMVSLVGSAMQSVGQVWLVLTLTHNPLQLGLVGALQLLPVLLFSLLGGVLADRWPKRKVLLLTQTAAMIQAFLLWALVATSSIQLWHLYILALLLGLTSSLDKPTRQAFVIEMVGREDLPNAVALESSLITLSRIVGPALGGVIIALSGVTILFLLNALSFVAVVIGLALIRSRELYAPKSREGKQQKTWQSLHEGLSYVWGTPVILSVTVLVGLVLLFGSNFNVVLPLVATEVLNAGATGFGFLSAAIGVGALSAALWLAWSNQRTTICGLLIWMLIFALLEAIFGISRIYIFSVMLIASVGFAENIFAAQAITLLQTIAPDHLRGRVMSVYILFFDGSVPVGYLLVGWLASLYGAPVTLLICAMLCLIVVGSGWLWYRTVVRAFVE